MKKEYIASYQDGKGECWDLVIYANYWREAHKIAKQQEDVYGKLWSLRLKR